MQAKSAKKKRKPIEEFVQPFIIYKYELHKFFPQIKKALQLVTS